MSFRFLTFSIAFLVIATVSVEPAAAQTPSLSSSIAPTSQFRLSPGESKTFTWTIAVAGATTGVQVTPSIEAPTGFLTEADLSPFTLGGPNGNTQRSIDVRIELPPDAGDLPTDPRPMLLRASTPGIGGAGAPETTEQTVFLTYVAPIVPPAPAPPDYTWAIASAIAGAVLLIGALVYFLQARRVRLAIDHPVKRFNIGTGGSYKVVVTNPSKVPQNVQLRIRDLPKEWSAAFSFPTVPLHGGEKAIVPLWVNVPIEAQPNEHLGFRIQARPNRFSPWIVTRRLQADTLDVTVNQPTA